VLYYFQAASRPSNLTTKQGTKNIIPYAEADFPEPEFIKGRAKVHTLSPATCPLTEKTNNETIMPSRIAQMALAACLSVLCIACPKPGDAPPKRRLQHLVAIVFKLESIEGGTATFSGNLTEFASNVNTLAETLGIPSEQIQPSGPLRS